MSLHNPARRPWGTARGARVVTMAAWALVGISALAAAAFWIEMLRGNDALLVPAIIAFNVSIFLDIGALFADLGSAQRRGVEESAALPRFPGAWSTGAGLGTVVFTMLSPARDAVPHLLWGLLMLVGGALVFVSPLLLARHRERRQHHRIDVRATGIRTQAHVTDVRTFYREHFPKYRVTVRFTDQDGNQRWVTQTAPAGAGKVAKSRDLPLYYDAAAPGRKRSLVIDWPR